MDSGVPRVSPRPNQANSDERLGGESRSIVWLKPQRVRLPPFAGMRRQRPRRDWSPISRRRRWRQRIFWALMAAFVAVLLSAWYLAKRDTGGSEVDLNLERGAKLHEIFRDTPLRR